jgi:hypothetical protein
MAAKVKKTRARGDAKSVVALEAGTELEELAAVEVLDEDPLELVLLAVLLPELEPVEVELLELVAVELEPTVVVPLETVEVETRDEEPLEEPVDEAALDDGEAVAPRSWN